MRPVSRVRPASRRGVLLLALVLPAVARAEEAAGTASGHTHYTEEIEIEGHSENAVGSSDAASAGRITRQLVEDRPILRPGEALELVPGLIITQHSGAGKANQYFLRGFNLDHGTDFLTTLDGMPLNLRTHAHGQGYTDLNFLIPELIQRLDYFKGPYFASKGDFASAGGADIQYAESLPHNLLEITGGSFLYGRALFAGSPELGGGKLLYGLELFHEDGPWDHPDDDRRVNGVLRYTRPIGDGEWGVTAMGYYGLWNSTDQIPRRAVESGLIDRFGAIDPTTGGSSHRFSLSADYQQGVAGGVLVAWSASTDAIALHATVGWEARHDRIDPVALYPTAARRRLATVRQDSVGESSAAVVAEAELGLTRWLRAVAGLRYDRYLFDVSSDNPANSGREGAGRASPKLSAIVGPWAKTEFSPTSGSASIPTTRAA